MEIRDSYAQQIVSLFRYSDFRDRSAQVIRDILTGNHPKSELPLLPKPDSVLAEDSGELETKVALIWDDAKFNFTFFWKKGEKGDNYILEDIV